MGRVLAVGLLTLTGLFNLVGCGSPFQGTLANRDGNGLGPTAAPNQAQITSVSPSSIAAEGPSFTLTVNGLNFLPATTVLWDNGTSLATTYVSSTVLKAQVPGSLIVKPNSVTLIPSPVGTFNFGAVFTVTVPPLKGNNAVSFSKASIEANDIAWNATNQLFYLSVSTRNGVNPKSLVTLNPQTSTFGSFVSTGLEPGAISISPDGSYLYAGLDSAGSARRYSLPTLQADLDIPLGNYTYNAEPYYAIDLQAQPGSPRTVAISRGVKALSPSELGGVVMYDDALPRPQSVPGFSASLTLIDFLTWNPDGQSLYGTSQSGSTFALISASSAGLSLQQQPTAGITPLGVHVHFEPATGYLYGDSGNVIDPIKQANVATYPTKAIQGGFNTPPIMTTDGTLNIAYFLGQTSYVSTQGSYALEAFDLTHFTFLGAIPIAGISGTPYKLMRWGSNGLAFLTVGPSTSGNGVYLVSGGFVTSPASP